MTAKPFHPKVPRSPGNREFLDHANPFAKILDLATDAIVSVDKGRSIVFFNRAAERMFGYAAEEVCGKSLDILLPAKPAGVGWEHAEILNPLSPAGPNSEAQWEMQGRRKDGSEFRAHASQSSITLKGRTLFTYCLQEVTPRILTEQRLRATLREKEVLLEEVHHRVKNNLQVITSLLGLQARSIKNAATREKFEESRYRIQAMAMLHEILFESSSLAEIDFADYLRRLAEYLVRSYGAAGRIRLQVDLEPLSCHRDVALPCGLIVNELLSNAFKYAFPGSRSGGVRIQLRREPNRSVHLLVGDDGVGLPQDFDWETSPTLGLRLVRTLAGQIEAKIESKRHQSTKHHGTEFSITFQDGLLVGTK